MGNDSMKEMPAAQILRALVTLDKGKTGADHLDEDRTYT